MIKYETLKSVVSSLGTNQINRTIEDFQAERKLLIDLVEQSAEALRILEEEVKSLKDEVNRLKGEQASPKFGRKKTKEDISSEEERKDNQNANPKKSKEKNNKIKITRNVLCPVDKTQLPSDAVFKGHETVIIQDLLISPDNIAFKKEVYYSASLNKNITGELPFGYTGGFGANIRSLILSLYHASKMSQRAIVDFLTTHGVHISKATVSRIIVDAAEIFKSDKEAIINVGLQTTNYHQMDDTGAKVNGVNHYVHVLCNDYFTAYFTRPDKSRLTLLEILSGDNLEFQFDEQAYKLMRSLQLSAQAVLSLKARINGKSRLNKTDLVLILDELFPNSPARRRIVTEASAISAYQKREDAIQLLLCDDAPQFKQITEELALCWVHEGRHYKKLVPIFKEYQIEMDKFLERFWSFYKKLLKYKDSPDNIGADSLSQEFDLIFDVNSVKYRTLSGQIEKTKNKKTELLAVLNHPEIPLHNNASELGARAHVRKRDVSLQTRTTNGTKAKDTMMTVVETAKKLGINVFNYIHDRINHTLDRTLADEMKIRAGIA